MHNLLLYTTSLRSYHSFLTMRTDRIRSHLSYSVWSVSLHTIYSGLIPFHLFSSTIILCHPEQSHHIPPHLILFHLISLHLILSHLISLHLILFHLISLHLILSHLISLNSSGPATVPLVKDTFASERRKAKTLNFSIAYGKTVLLNINKSNDSSKMCIKTLEIRKLEEFNQKVSNYITSVDRLVFRLFIYVHTSLQYH